MDRGLVERARAGDQEAYEILVDKGEMWSTDARGGDLLEHPRGRLESPVVVGRSTEAIDQERLTDPVRVLIVEDHPMYRAGLRSLLDAIPWVRSAGEAGTGAAALRIAAEAPIDVAMMDL